MNVYITKNGDFSRGHLINTRERRYARRVFTSDVLPSIVWQIKGLLIAYINTLINVFQDPVRV